MTVYPVDHLFLVNAGDGRALPFSELTDAIGEACRRAAPAKGREVWVLDEAGAAQIVLTAEEVRRTCKDAGRTPRGARLDPARTKTSISTPVDTEMVCSDLGRRLETLARACGTGKISEAAFAEELLKLEADAAAPHGFTLVVSHTLDDWTMVQVHRKAPKEVCASFEFLPATGEFREPGSGPGL